MRHPGRVVIIDDADVSHGFLLRHQDIPSRCQRPAGMTASICASIIDGTRAMCGRPCNTPSVDMPQHLKKKQTPAPCGHRARHVWNKLQQYTDHWPIQPRQLVNSHDRVYPQLGSRSVTCKQVCTIAGLAISSYTFLSAPARVSSSYVSSPTSTRSPQPRRGTSSSSVRPTRCGRAQSEDVTANAVLRRSNPWAWWCWQSQRRHWGADTPSVPCRGPKRRCGERRAASTPARPSRGA